MSAPRVWVATRDEAEAVARLLIAFRNHNGQDWPSDNAFLASVERLFDDADTEFLLGTPHDDAPPAGVAQLRFRYGSGAPATTACSRISTSPSPPAAPAWAARWCRRRVDRARERGCRRIELDANERNEAALALYGEFGFSATENAYGGRDLYMRLHLDDPV